MAILDDLRREYGLALLFITHDLELAAAVCDRTCGDVRRADRGDAGGGRAARPTRCTPTRRRCRPPARPSTATAQRLAAIPGRPLSAFEAPTGCPFAPRCPFAAGPLPRPATRCSSELDGGRGALPARGRAARAEQAGGSMPDDEPSCEVARACARSSASWSPSTTSRSLIARRRVAGDRRRVRLGQDDDRPDDRRARAADGGHDRRLRARPLAAGPRGAPSGAPRGARSRSSSRTRTPASTRARRAAASIDEVLRLHARAAPPASGGTRVAELARPGRPRRPASCARCPARSRAASASGSRSRGRWRPSRGC